MKNLITALFALVLLANCGVKKADPINPTPALAVGERDLPAGVLYSKGKNFLIKSSVEQLSVGEEAKNYDFSIDYFIATKELVPLNDSYLVEVKYGMPSMPLMKIRPAVISYPETGKVSVLFAIDMAQDWRIILRIYKKDGTLEDTITYNYYIPE